MNDKYARAMKYLKSNPGKIVHAWHFPTEPFGCLFKYAGKRSGNRKGEWIGCLTQVRNGGGVAQNQRLTTAIREDERIPLYPEEITVDNLHVFVEWQRRLDKELKRTT